MLSLLIPSVPGTYYCQDVADVLDPAYPKRPLVWNAIVSASSQNDASASQKQEMIHMLLQIQTEQMGRLAMVPVSLVKPHKLELLATQTDAVLRARSAIVIRVNDEIALFFTAVDDDDVQRMANQHQSSLLGVLDRANLNRLYLAPQSRVHLRVVYCGPGTDIPAHLASVLGSFNVVGSEQDQESLYEQSASASSGSPVSVIDPGVKRALLSAQRWDASTVQHLLVMLDRNVPRGEVSERSRSGISPEALIDQAEAMPTDTPKQARAQFLVIQKAIYYAVKQRIPKQSLAEYLQVLSSWHRFHAATCCISLKHSRDNSLWWAEASYALCPESADAMWTYALALLHAERYMDAYVMLQKSAVLFKDNFPVYHALYAYIQSRLNHPVDAWYHLRRLETCVQSQATPCKGKRRRNTVQGTAERDAQSHWESIEADVPFDLAANATTIRQGIERLKTASVTEQAQALDLSDLVKLPACSTTTYLTLSFGVMAMVTERQERTNGSKRPRADTLPTSSTSTLKLTPSDCDKRLSAHALHVISKFTDKQTTFQEQLAFDREAAAMVRVVALAPSENRGEHGVCVGSKCIPGGSFVLPIRMLVTTLREYDTEVDDLNRITYEPYVFGVQNKNLICLMTQEHGNLSRSINDYRSFSPSGPWKDMAVMIAAPLAEQRMLELHQEKEYGKRVNCLMVEARRDDLAYPYLFIVNTRDLQPGEELIVDYGWDYWYTLSKSVTNHQLVAKLANTISARTTEHNRTTNFAPLHLRELC